MLTWRASPVLAHEQSCARKTRTTRPAGIDTDFGDAPVLLATRTDDAELDTAGAQLVVPSDRCGARYVSAVTGIWIGAHRLPGAPPPKG